MEIYNEQLPLGDDHDHGGEEEDLTDLLNRFFNDFFGEPFQTDDPKKPDNNS